MRFCRKFVWLIIPIFMWACEARTDKTDTLFELVPPSHSSVAFVNQLTEDKDFNIIEYLYYFNGGGVAMGDINNDGLSDLYFSGNQVDNRLYLNRGNFKFDDITQSAGVAGQGNWKTGVTMVDINADGHLDIFVCGVGSYKKFSGFNQLFINNGDLTFTDRTKEYGLAFKGFSTHAAFFDYDLDGDLDMYLLNHSVHTERSYGKVSLRYEKDSLAGDRLYKNQRNETGKVFYEDVSDLAGIHSNHIGYGLGIGISDINRDGYPDIYVSNDFTENDYLYINKRDGTFSQQLEKVTEHTSRFSMGNDLADINNDLLPDIITLDMLPRDESVIKTSAGEDSYEVYAFKLKYGYHKQVSRNTLQLNRGALDSGGLVFSDIAPAAGVEATDWSWGPLMADFDGDGWKDIFISNGIVRRPNDMDYINFISSDSVQKLEDVLPWIRKMPEGNVSNFIFRNRGDLTFEDKTNAWGLALPGISNGAAYGDLDNDGDPDLVVNRIGDTPLIYKNGTDARDFVKLTLAGDSLNGNTHAIGAKIILKQNDVTQVQELFPSRGWCSSSNYALTFGLPHSTDDYEMTVIWPDGKTEIRRSNARTQKFTYAEDLPRYRWPDATNTLLRSVPAPDFIHKEDEFNAFNRESLIPHMLTTEGPPIATGDVNSDGLEDVFIGGAKGQAGELFLQTTNGTFTKHPVNDFASHRFCEDIGAVFLDVDGDRDADLVVVSGGQEALDEVELLRPRLYKNDGSGNLKLSNDAFPAVYLHASCVKPADFDNDGDIDIFIGASVMPMLYGMSPVSILLKNNGQGKFTNDPSWLGQSRFDNPTRVRPGMVKDAVWAHVNSDSLIDLVLVGEWMPITILLQQQNHKFQNATQQYGLEKTRGWWNAIAAKDFEGDGDVDFVAGNVGWNSRLTASDDKPLKMFLGDFDSNGGSDHILVYYNGDKEYPFPSRDQLVKQIPSLKKKFLSYRDYRDVRLEDIVTPQQQGNSAVMQADEFSSLYLENQTGQFKRTALPLEAQLFPVFDIEIDDVNNDGAQDILLVGNLTATQPEIGPYDAGVGLVLEGQKGSAFQAMAPIASGFIVRGEGREIAVLNRGKKNKLILVSRNNNTIVAFKQTKNE